MRGKVVTALTPIDGRGGKVFIEGEYWNAVSDVPVEQGQRVEIIEMQGLTLKSETIDHVKECISWTSWKNRFV